MRFIFILLLTISAVSGQFLPFPGEVNDVATPGTPVDNTTTSGCTGSSGAWTCTGTPSITLTDASAAAIYYSLSTTPNCTGTGTLYTGAFNGNSSTFTLKAIGCNGITGGGVLTSVYTISAASPSLIQQTTCHETAGGTLSCALTNPVASGDSVVFAILFNFNAFCTSVDFNSNALTNDFANAQVYVQTYHLGNITTGGTTATATCSGTAEGVLSEFSVIAGTLDQKGGGGTAGTTWSVTTASTLSQAAEIAVGWVGNLSTNTWTIGGSLFTSGNCITAQFNYSGFFCWALTSSTSSVTFNGTATITSSNEVVVTYK